MSHLRELVILFCLSSVVCGVPVLLWESSASSEKDDVVPALSQLDVDEFSNHLIKKVHVHKPLIVLFLEETLSVEDFSWQDASHRGSFPQIQNITAMSAGLEFIPSVDSPETALKELTLSHDYIWKKYDGKKLPSESGVILVVKMNDPLISEDRPEMLRRHDENIADVYSQLLAKHSRLVAIYTGKQSSWMELESNRVRREAASDEKGVDYVYEDILLHSSSPPLLVDNGNNITLTTSPELKGDKRKGFSRLITTFFMNEEPKKVILRLKFPKGEDRWSLTEIEYQSDDRSLVLTPSTEITAAFDKSYISANPVTFKNDSVPGVYLKFHDLQVQAYSTKKEFSPTEEDEGPPFFTEAIWSGLIVTFVLGLILTWGIVMLLDIRTMDRFDDPKGKTISVTASD